MKKHICFIVMGMVFAGLIYFITVCELFVATDNFLGLHNQDLDEIRRIIYSKNLSEGTVVDKVYFEDSSLVYDSELREYFITVDENFSGVFNADEGVELYWIDNELEELDEFVAKEKIANNESIKLFCVYNTKYQIISIKMTTLPIIKIESEDMPTIVDGEKIYENGKITILESVNKDTLTYKEQTYPMKYRYRGDLSLKFEKKSFRLQLSDGENISKSLFGLRKDDDWNLSACYTDYSLIREAVVLSLLNQMAELEENPYIHPQGMVFCELFINDEYWGVYECLETMDTKQVSINKDHDFIYKSNYFGVFDPDELRSYGQFEEDFLNIELEYYPPEHKYNRYDNIADFTQFYYDNTYTYAELSKVVHMDNFIDNYIAKMSLSLVDNDIKNLYYCFEKQEDGSFRIRKEYYDFNYSFGDRYSATGYNNVKEYPSENVLYTDTLEESIIDYELFVKDYVDRYWFLRTNVFSNENIIATIDKYYNEIVSSGGNIRNQIRWELEIDIDYEDEYERLIKFVNDHMKDVDKFIVHLSSEFLV